MLRGVVCLGHDSGCVRCGALSGHVRLHCPSLQERHDGAYRLHGVLDRFSFASGYRVDERKYVDASGAYVDKRVLPHGSDYLATGAGGVL